LADSPESIRRGLADRKVPVWLPTLMVLADAAIPQSWDVTSDSLAAWLAGRIGAERLILVKHFESAAGTGRSVDLFGGNMIDKAFVDFMAASGVPAFILGHNEHGAIRDGVSEDACIRIVM